MHQGGNRVPGFMDPTMQQNTSQDSDVENEPQNSATGSEETKTTEGSGFFSSNPFDENEANVYVLFKNGKAPLKYARPRVLNTTTIYDIKNELFVEWGVPIGGQRLVVGDLELEDNSKTLKDYQIDITKPCSIALFSNIDVPEAESVSDASDRESSPPISRVYGPTYYTNHSFRNDEDGEYNDYDLYEKRPSHDLVGLKNQGATCYLNSLLQVFYLTPEFRRMIFRIPRPYDLLLGGEKKQDQDISEESTNDKSENKKDEKEFTNKPNENPKDDKSDRKKDIIFQMQMLFARMQFATVSSVSTSGLTTSFGWDNSDIFVQHDVQELNRVLCDNIEEKMKGKEGEYSIAKLYKGIMLNMIKCTNCQRVSTREEDFYDISLVIKGKKNINESFNEFTEVERMENENAYFCEKCNSKQTAEKSIKFKTVPTILNLQLKRFEFDWDANIRVKLNDEIAFPNLLDMSPYMVDPSVIAQLEQEKSSSTNDNPSSIELETNPIYELVAILVHSGNAGFGHYYAFIKNFTDGKWYKFNDEHVNQVDETDVLAQNWLGGSDRSSAYGWSSTMAMQRSATPYMLVYRKRSTPSSVEKQIDEESSVFSSSKRRAVDDFRAPPVADEEIPQQILEFLERDKERKEAKRKERERDANSSNIIVYRNRAELPLKKVKVDKNATLAELRSEVIAAVCNESSEQYHYRFRRIANRKNQTKRPMNLFKEADYEKSLIELGLDKKQYIYLEQDTDPTFPGLEQDIDDDRALVLIRLWSKELRRPTSIRDFIFPKNLTLGQVKQILADKYVKLKPEEMVVVEEETERTVNFLTNDNDTLKFYGIISGDILHIEPLSKEHFEEKGKTVSFTQLYYDEKYNKLIVTISETNHSFKKRKPEMEIKEIKKLKTSEDPNEWTTHKMGFKLVTNKTHTLGNLKTVIALKIGVDPRLIRLYDKDSISMGEYCRILKGNNRKLGTVLLKLYGGAKISTDLGLEILEQPEDLKKGDKLIHVRYYNINREFGGVLEIKIHKSETLRDLKTKLKEVTGVSEDHQILSEWYNEHFYKLFPNEKDTIAQSKIRKNDILRMDTISDPHLNISENINGGQTVIAFQLAGFVAWDSTAYGKKEMQTSFPELLTIPETASLFDLRLAVAERAGVPFHNINIATASNFPIYEGTITPIKEMTKLGLGYAFEEKEKKQKIDNGEGMKEGDEDEIAQKLSEQENRDGKTWNFKNERKVILKKSRVRDLEVICWEDMRKKVEKPTGSATRTNKWSSRDGEDLKIKN